MNYFKEYLKSFPECNIGVIPDDPKDQEVAMQMTKLLNHAKYTSMKEMEEILVRGMIDE